MQVWKSDLAVNDGRFTALTLGGRGIGPGDPSQLMGVAAPLDGDAFGGAGVDAVAAAATPSVAGTPMPTPIVLVEQQPQSQSSQSTLPPLMSTTLATPGEEASFSPATLSASASHAPRIPSRLTGTLRGGGSGGTSTGDVRLPHGSLYRSSVGGGGANNIGGIIVGDGGVDADLDASPLAGNVVRTPTAAHAVLPPEHQSGRLITEEEGGDEGGGGDVGETDEGDDGLVSARRPYKQQQDQYQQRYQQQYQQYHPPQQYQAQGRGQNAGRWGEQDDPTSAAPNDNYVEDFAAGNSHDWDDDRGDDTVGRRDERLPPLHHHERLHGHLGGSSIRETAHHEYRTHPRPPQYVATSHAAAAVTSISSAASLAAMDDDGDSLLHPANKRYQHHFPQQQRRLPNHLIQAVQVHHPGAVGTGGKPPGTISVVLRHP